MSLSDEQRAKLERKLQSGNSVPVRDVRVDAEDMRALLSERDCYKEALENIATGAIAGMPEHCADASYVRAEIATETLGMDKQNPVDAETGGDCD